MTCRQFRPFIVDLARDAIDAAAVELLERHVRRCPDCHALFQRERMMSASLRRASRVPVVPAPDASREEALLAAFDAASTVPRTRHRTRWIRSAAMAATLLLGAAALWRPMHPVSTVRRSEATRVGGTDGPVSTSPSASGATHVALPEVARVDGEPVRPTRHRGVSRRIDVRDEAIEDAVFVAWPGASAGPRLESGELMRVDLPVSILPALGLWPPESAEITVPVEVLVGQDGFARAFRLVHNEEKQP
jgi:hypothetical protein